MSEPLLVLFDGNAIVHRAYHAFGPSKGRQGTALTVRKTGEVVSAVYGFAMIMLKVLNELKPTHLAIAFDKKGPTFRHDLFDAYKAQRPATPEDLVSQITRVKQLVKAFNIPLFELDKYEADDVLGTLSRQAAEKGIDTVIVTGDADTMQLVRPHVKVLYPRTGFSDTQLFDEAAVKEKFGVGPEHIADYKALVGDPSDNIPGVPGIGDKTAVKLINEFGSVEEIYQHLDEVTPARTKTILETGVEAAKQSKELATIVTDTPITLDLDSCKVSNYDRQAAAALFRELEFFSLLPKLPPSGEESTAIEVKTAHVDGEYRIVSTPEDLDEIVNRLTNAPVFSFDTETTGFNAMQDRLVGISASVEEGKAYYVPVGHAALDQITQLPLEQVAMRLKPVFGDGNKPKVAHNGKFDMMVLEENGIPVRGLASDTTIAAYLLGEKALGLKELAFNKLAIEMTPITSLIGSGKKQVTFDKVDIKSAAAYSGADADMTLRLDAVLRKELEAQNLMKLYREVEIPLIPILMQMERVGIAIDISILGELSRSLGEQAEALARKIYEEAKHEFNINSPIQLSKVLFEEMQLPSGRRGKGKFSTDASVLEDLRHIHPIAGYILQYRQLTKIKGTYIDALPELVSLKDGRIHTSFNQTRTSTGRLSSSDPNMQNIPVRGELGGQVRQAFVAAPGYSLLAGDYSQIDLRVLAHLSNDAELVRAFRRDEDIHSATASLMFNVPKDKITKDMRRFAKTINFGVIYGMSEYGLEQATELSRQEAARFIQTYFEKYPGVVKYLEKVKEKARKDGYVETLLGRRRYISDINSPNRQVRESAERMAINMPVQGTSADIIKVAMINLSREMERLKLKSRMLLQVHDELVFEIPPDEAEVMFKMVPEIMNSAVTLNVPLKVDTKSGKNWGEMK